jgi:hypothetical protein
VGAVRGADGARPDSAGPQLLAPRWSCPRLLAREHARRIALLYTPLWFEWFGYALVVATTPAIPVSVGIAILRYRLYDIDRIINRTLVYGALTVVLALPYFAGVTLTQDFLQAFTGENALPQIAVVASTLAIAALFNPLRRRIQAFIDRSFYRRKYDAAKTLEEFGTTLRAVSDLDGLANELTGVVRATVQPAHVSLWLASDCGKGDR